MSNLDSDSSSQINVPPTRPNALWKVIVSEIRCPECHSSQTKATTGKRTNGEGLSEHYRTCGSCHIRFRVVFE